MPKRTRLIIEVLKIIATSSLDLGVPCKFTEGELNSLWVSEKVQDLKHNEFGSKTKTLCDKRQ